MSQQELMLEVAAKLLNDKDNSSIREDLPTIINGILKPFVKKSKVTNTKTELIVSNVIRSFGICSRCRSGELKQSSDLFCKNCKSVLKEKAKNLIE